MCNPEIGLSIDEHDYAYPVGMPEKYQKIYKSEMVMIDEENSSDFLASTTQSTKKFFFMLMQICNQVKGTTFYT